mgnify:CR=1 FL=1
MKQKLKNAGEEDVIFFKRMYCYLQRPGVSSLIKRGMRRRRRREKVKIINEQMED